LTVQIPSTGVAATHVGPQLPALRVSTSMSFVPLDKFSFASSIFDFWFALVSRACFCPVAAEQVTLMIVEYGRPTNAASVDRHRPCSHDIDPSISAT
jgi:hypothetical protein